MSTVRSRSINNSVTHLFGYTQRNVSTGKITKYDGSNIRTYVRSSIDDTLGNKGGENPVSHTKRNIVPASLALPTALSADRSHTSTLYHTRETALGTFGSHYGSVDLDAAVAALYADAIGAMPMSASLVTNAIEFSSLKTLVPGLVKGFKSLWKHKIARRSVKDLAGSHLAYSFGLAPLLSDFRSMLDVRSNVNRRIQQLLDRNGRTVRLRYRATGRGEGKASVYYPWDNSVVYNGFTYGKTTLSSTIAADVTSFFVPNGESQCKLWSSALGLSSPLTNAWEIVPFSFVIDWFIPIGETFLAVENRLGMHETVRSCAISNVTISEKKVTEYSTALVASSTAYPGWSGLKLQGAGGSVSSYTRYPTTGLPGIGVPAPSGWTISRTALGVSLLAQKAL